MARIAGVNIPNQKRVPIGLTYIHGIGRTKALQICGRVGIPIERRVHEMTDDEVSKRERQSRYGIEQRDLRHAPAPQLQHVAEDHEDRDEVEERDEEHASGFDRERRAVLQLCAHPRRDDPPVQRERVAQFNHLAPQDGARPGQRAARR